MPPAATLLPPGEDVVYFERGKGLAAAPALRPFGALRFALAALVMAHHFGIDLSPPWLKALVVPVAPGDIAVVVFFVLSGFIILDAVMHFYAGRARQFLGNRLLRILPQFLAALVLSIVVHAALWKFDVLHSIDGEKLGADIFTAPSIAANFLSVIPFMGWSGRQNGYVYLWPVWSLRVEMVFYLAVFASVMFAAFAARRTPYDKALRLAWAVLAAAALASAAAVMLLGAASSLQFAPYFVFGGAVFLGSRGSRAALVFAGLSLGLMLVHNWIYNPGIFAEFPRSHAAQVLLFGALIAAFVWLACRSRRSARGWDRLLGDLAYPLFLNHLTVGVLMKSLWPQSSIAGIAIAVVLSLILAVAMQATVEPVIKSWRDRWRGAAL